MDMDNSQLSQNKSWLHSQGLTPGQPTRQYFLTGLVNHDDREHTESRLTSAFDQPKSEITIAPAEQQARIDPRIYKTFVSTK